MIHTDKLSVLFDKVTTALNQRKEIVEIKYTKYYEQIVKALMLRGLVRSYHLKSDTGCLTLLLNIYPNLHIKYTRISKPGKRVYMNSSEIDNLNINQDCNGFYLISTIQGILSNYNIKNSNLGGEILVKFNYEYA
jgi:ribosomal protein S8